MGYSTQESQQKAVLVNVEFYDSNKINSPLNAVNEFKELSLSSGAIIVANVTGNVSGTAATVVVFSVLIK